MANLHTDSEAQPLVSIVANFYKSEKFIVKLMKSVISQSYGNWELIAVNDCSPGNDAELLEKWAAKPEAKGRIRIINNPVNLGISKAKRVGINAAKGEYITFIDGDDWLMPNALEAMVKPAVENNLDLVMTDIWRVYPPYWLNSLNKRLMVSNADYMRLIGKDEIMERYMIHFYGSHCMSNSSYWSRLYRTELLKETRLPDDLPNDFLEDCILNMLYLEKCDQVMFVNKATYCWRWGGITSGSKKRRIDDYKWRGIIDQSAYYYRLRLKRIKANKFDKALVPLRIELKNIIVEAMCQLAELGDDSKLREAINYCYTLPEYDEIALIPSEKVMRYKEFADLYIKRDTDAIIDYLHQQMQSGKLKKLFKRILSSMS